MLISLRLGGKRESPYCCVCKALKRLRRQGQQLYYIKKFSEYSSAVIWCGHMHDPIAWSDCHKCGARKVVMHKVLRLAQS